MAEQMQHLQEELVFQRQAELIYAMTFLLLCMLEAILWNFQRKPGTGFPDRGVHIDLALALQRIQIVVGRRNVVRARKEACFA